MSEVDEWCGRGWELYREWREPHPLFPLLRVLCVVRRSDGRSRLCVGSDHGLVHWFAVQHPSVWGLTAEGEWRMAMRVVRDALVVVSAEGSSQALNATAWVQAHPLLWEYLSEDLYADGAARERAMLCIFADLGCVKGVLQDRDTGRSLWVTAACPVTAMDLLEAALGTPTPDWRSAKQRAGKGSARK
jgi:hypothetical protein